MKGQRTDLKPESNKLRLERPGLRPEILDLRPEKRSLRPEGPGLRPERLDLRPERLDLRPKRLDLRPKRPDLRPEKLDLKPEGPGEGGGRTNKQTDGQTKVPLCSTGHHPLQSRCPATHHLQSPIYEAGQRVSPTTYCPWATGSDLKSDLSDPKVGHPDPKSGSHMVTGIRCPAWSDLLKRWREQSSCRIRR